MTLQELINNSVRLRDAAADLAAQEKVLRAEKEEVDNEIMAMLDAMGVDRAGTDTVNVSITTANVANVTDWDAFYTFVSKHQAPYLLQRRVAAGALEEMVQLHGDIPGVSFFEKRGVSLRKR